MIGLTLVVSMGVLPPPEGVVQRRDLDKTNADLFVTAPAPVPGIQPLGDRGGPGRAGVDEISPNGWGQARFASKPTSYSAVDPATAEEVMNLDVSQGPLADLGKDGVVVSRKAATSHGWEIGTPSRRSSPRPASSG